MINILTREVFMDKYYVYEGFAETEKEFIDYDEALSHAIHLSTLVEGVGLISDKSNGKYFFVDAGIEGRKFWAESLDESRKLIKELWGI